MIIDAHTHLGVFHGKTYSAPMLRASMRKAGIDHALVFAGRLNALPTDALIRAAGDYKEFSVIGTPSFEKRTQALERRFTAYLKKLFHIS